MKTILDGALRKAMALTTQQDPVGATRVIQKALSGRGWDKDGTPDSEAAKAGASSRLADSAWSPLAPPQSETVFAKAARKESPVKETPLEKPIIEAPEAAPAVVSPIADMIESLQKTFAQGFGFHAFDVPKDGDAIVPEPGNAGASEFMRRRYECEAGSRGYKLFVPGSAAQSRPRSLPLIVMLHGCKQDPDDFALGTGMNALAEERGFLVVYPEQSARSNQMGCWNWFSTRDQERDSGEPAIIAGITREVSAEFPVDPERVFVAGLSAGGAMAAILSATYPDLFKAAGIHSGLPCGVATDFSSAFNVMRNGATLPAGAAPETNVRTIVFQGGQDRTVHPSNAALIVTFARAGLDGAVETKQRGRSENGVAYERIIIADGSGTPQVEYWAVETLGHAWSGGSQRGSFTDPNGPDASREMLRFFLQH